MKKELFPLALVLATAVSCSGGRKIQDQQPSGASVPAAVAVQCEDLAVNKVTDPGVAPNTYEFTAVAAKIGPVSLRYADIDFGDGSSSQVVITDGTSSAETSHPYATPDTIEHLTAKASIHAELNGAMVDVGGSVCTAQIVLVP